MDNSSGQVLRVLQRQARPHNPDGRQVSHQWIGAQERLYSQEWCQLAVNGLLVWRQWWCRQTLCQWCRLRMAFRYSQLWCRLWLNVIYILCHRCDQRCLECLALSLYFPVLFQSWPPRRQQCDPQILLSIQHKRIHSAHFKCIPKFYYCSYLNATWIYLW